MSSATGIVDSLPEAVRALRAGDRRILARALSALEDGDALGEGLMANVRSSPDYRRAPVLALTGPPGVGKSTLSSAFATAAVGDGHTVAVLAVDPSSPISGGAVLGDRVRMAGGTGGGVFFRSFANRGVVGGLARVIPAAIELVSAAGYDLVFVETVGVGQSEIDVRKEADVTVVVVAPNMGDDVQAAKAGLLEIADVLLVNKCDLPDAGSAVRQLRTSAAMRQSDAQPAEILKVGAATGENIAVTWAIVAQLLTDVARSKADDARRARGALLNDVALSVSGLVRSAADGMALDPDSVLGQLVGGRLSGGEAVERIERLLTSDPAGP